MKKSSVFKKLPLLFAAIILLLSALALYLSGAFNRGVYAAPQTYSDNDSQYGFRYDRFYVTYDIKADRTWHVTEEMEVTFSGSRSTGIIRDIPVNAGDRVRNIKAWEMGESARKDTEYDVYTEDSDFVSVKLSDGRNKTNQTRVYIMEYDYAVTKPAKNEKNALNLNPIGYGHTAEMVDVKITLNLPDGFIGDGINCYYGTQGNDEPDNSVWRLQGNTVVAELSELNRYKQYEGVTFSIKFEDGVLSVKHDFTPYWVIIGACVLLAALFAIKLLLFNKHDLMPVPNFDAPNQMDPLVMGKLIDNKVDKSDVTSLIYYWANKGYLKIDMGEDEELSKGKAGDGKNVALIRIVQNLPESAPHYQKLMYGKLFASGDVVKISSLTNSFYSTVESVTKEVNAENGKLYDGKSMAVAVLFTLLGAAVMCVTPLLIGVASISSSFMVLMQLFMIIPAFVIFALTQTVKYNTLKLKKSKLILMYAGIAVLAAGFSCLYLLVTPGYVIETLPRLLLCAVGFAVIMLSVSIISRTDAYTEKLNTIIGFKDFISSVEKDKLETMLEENPEFYYQVLPYAHVLGVSDIWIEKFSALTVKAPRWVTNSFAENYFDFLIFNSVMNNLTRNMTTTFISRPSSNGLSGGFGGGHFGGFSGGGHGGGGSRGC